MKIQNQTASEAKNSSRANTLAHETRKKRVKIVRLQEGVISEGIISGMPNDTYSNSGFFCFHNCPD